MRYYEIAIDVKKVKKIAITSFLLIMAAVLAGCAPGTAIKQDEQIAAEETPAAQQKHITAIQVSDEPESTVITVKGDSLLTYTSVKQSLPLGLILYFPDTSLEADEKEFVLDNDIISSVTAAELVKDGPSKLSIAFKTDIPFEISRDEDETGLKIVFSKGEGVGVEEQENEGVEVIEPDAEAGDIISVVPATQLASIQPEQLENGMKIIVQADGMITDYKTFALSNPARIVFDLKDIKSPYKKEQKVPVNTQWVETIRHFSYPDKLRIVLDTNNDYLSAFSAKPIEKGLLISVGEGAEEILGTEKTPVLAAVSEPMPDEAVETLPDTSAEKTPGTDVGAVAAPATVAPPVPVAVVAGEPEIEAEPAPPVEESVPEAITYSTPALVNRIDFLSKEVGKSSIIIGTTRPVEYDIVKFDEKGLQLNLFDAKIQGFRQRPIITTRFESAVDRILPVYKPSMENNSKVLIELREMVPYTVEQEENVIQIYFEASAIQPKTLEQAALPEWQQMLEQLVEEDPALEIVEESDAAEAEIEELTVEAEGELEEFEEFEEEALAVDEKWAGEKIALDFYKTDIKNVLRILRDVSGKNFAIDKGVSGRVTLTLVKPVPWDQVLDLILRMNDLGYIMEGDIVRITTLKTIKKEQTLRREKLAAAQSIKIQEKEMEPLVTEYIPISYANPSSDIKPRLDEIKSKRGKIGIDARNNQIIMTDTADKIEQAKELVRIIDKVTPQVIIEARIVEVSEDFSLNIGTQWNADAAPLFLGDYANTWSMAMDHSTASSGTIGYSFAKLVGSPVLLDATLMAAEAEGETKIISAPKIVTLDNKQATISQGIEYPYLERDDTGGSSVKFKEIDLKLDVTPHVTPDNRISMVIDLIKNDIATITGGVPALATNAASTELLVNDGDTIVIGGIIKSNESVSENRFPVLSKIPLLGWLFKSQTTSKQKNELLIFITPKIVHLENI